MADIYYIYQDTLNTPYKGIGSAYFDINQEEWKQQLEKEWEKILAELEINSNQ